MILVRGNRLFFEDKVFRCAGGKGGFSADKREGDGCTPLGKFLLRECWVRADRLSVPQTGLKLRVIERDDGWCDDPGSGEYNKWVKLPFPSRHETFWREDGVYDVIVPLGYNDGPVVAGKGSAIFMHIAKVDYAPTEGCVALARGDLLGLLPKLDARTWVEIRAE